MHLNRLAQQLLHLLDRRAGGDTAGEVGDVGGVVPLGPLHHDRVLRHAPLNAAGRPAGEPPAGKDAVTATLPLPVLPEPEPSTDAAAAGPAADTAEPRLAEPPITGGKVEALMGRLIRVLSHSPLARPLPAVILTVLGLAGVAINGKAPKVAPAMSAAMSGEER